MGWKDDGAKPVPVGKSIVGQCLHRKSSSVAVVLNDAGVSQIEVEPSLHGATA